MSRNRKPASPEWIKLGGKAGEFAHCQRCGRGLKFDSGPVGVSTLIGAMDGFAKDHVSCRPNFTEPEIDSADDWINGRDTGISSATIFHVMTGRGTRYHDCYDVPHDPDDFGRCYRLLQHFPAWKLRLSEVAERFPKWAPMVVQWDEMEHLYLRDLPTGASRELYDLMQKLRATPC